MNDQERNASAETALSELDRIATGVQKRFEEGRRVLTFQEYLELFAQAPLRHGRDASRYVRDMFDSYGSRTIQQPWGEVRRFRLFDRPWAPERESREPELVGHEEIQNDVYRALCNFAQEGRANRLVLMHGPNGSAKSTAAACILRGLEEYSTQEEGALYRFHWVFPSRKTVRGSIGFGGDSKVSATEAESYAHLTDDEIDARLVLEVRDHPLFLIPNEERRELLLKMHEAAGASEPPSDWLLRGRLCHKNQQVYEALLMSNGGSMAEVLRHVQVERYFISRRYRVGAVTIGPQLSVDAGERQITADRSLSALPTALQATTLFEAHGELVEAQGGVLEFSDLLKRPLDAFRYLQLTLETGEVPLAQQNLETNCVMLGSANEIHLGAFREHPEYPSFRGRFELVRVPYLRNYHDEQRIFDTQITPYLDVHVAPHATWVAAQFSVLTRMLQPDNKNYPDELAAIAGDLTAFEKMELLASGKTPDRLDADATKLLRAGLGTVYREYEGSVEYEGKVGASPREMRTVLLDAAQSADYGYLSPFGVLSALDELCKRTSEYDWLKQKPVSGGYHDHKAFRETLRDRLLEKLEEDMRTASGLVEETKYQELFDKYVTHVSAGVKGEKIRNAITGDFEDPDERMMKEIEGYLNVEDDHEAYRRSLISSVAAWAIDHPGQQLDNALVFAEPLRRLRAAVFAERRRPVALLTRDLLTLLRGRREHPDRDDREVAPDLMEDQRTAALATLARLKELGYEDSSAHDTAAALLSSRFAELLA